MWFPDKNDADLERLAAIVFDLRRDKFRHEILERPQEGVWISPEKEKAMEARNDELLMEFDLETRRLILGN